MNRIIPILIGWSLWFNLIAPTTAHMLSHEHEHEAHHCEAQSCFIEHETDCSALNQLTPKKAEVVFSNNKVVFLPFLKIESKTQELHYSFLAEVSQNRGPPHVV